MTPHDPDRPLTLSEEIASKEARLSHLELKSEADDNLIQLLKEQNQNQADHLVKVCNEHEKTLQHLRQERDEAVRTAQEVSGIIEGVCRLGYEGLRRMRGQPPLEASPIKPVVVARTPHVPREEQPSARLTPADTSPNEVEDLLHRSTGTSRGQFAKIDSSEALLPRPTFLDRPRDPDAGDPRLPAFVRRVP